MEMLKTCFRIFVLSRIFYALIIIICINNSLIGEYDKANNLMMNSFENEKDKFKKFKYFDQDQSERIIDFQETSYLERNFLRIIKHFNSYDTMHFLHNSRLGYTNEKNYVFFPLLSRVIEMIENMLKNVSLFKNPLTLSLSLGLVITNLICFINGILFVR